MGKSRDLAGSPPCKKSHQRRSSSAVCLPSSALLANASECEAHALLVRSGWACKAGASFALPGSRSSKLGQAQECKLKAHSWELSLPLSWTALVEKHWEENQGLGRGWHLTNWEHMHGLCEQACTLYGHEMLLLNWGQEPSVLMWGHNLVVQGQTTKADRSDVDLERKQHQKNPPQFYFKTCWLGEPGWEAACTFPCTLPAGTFQVRGGLYFCHIAILAFM